MYNNPANENTMDNGRVTKETGYILLQSTQRRYSYALIASERRNHCFSVAHGISEDGLAMKFEQKITKSYAS